MKMILLLLVGFLPTVSFGSTLDFHQTLERALSRSPEFQTQKLKRDNARLETKNAWFALLPTADLQASHTYLQQNTSAYFIPEYRHLPWSNQAGLTVKENLYDNGVTWRKARSAELNEDLQDLALESAQARLKINVAKAYFDMSLAVAVLELQRQQIQTLNTQFRTIESRYRQGLSSNRDYLRIKAQGQSSEIGLLSQEIELNQAKQALRTLIGENEATEFQPLRLPKGLPPAVRGPIDPEQSYEFKSANLRDRISEITAESAERLFWPRLSLQGSYNYTVPQYLGDNVAGVDNPYWNLQFMIVLEYRLWDWGSTSRTVQIAGNQERIDKLTQDSGRLKVRQDLIQLESQLELLRRSYSVSQQILQANQEAFESLNRGYRDGKISYLDLITSLNSVYSSRSQDIGLRFNILKTQLEWAYYQGNIDEILKNL